MRSRICYIVAALICNATIAQNAIQRLDENIEISTEAQITASKGQSPLWLNANRHGMGSVVGDNGYLRARLVKKAENDSTHSWRIGYGADIALQYNSENSWFVQQLYADFDYRRIRLSIGCKERPMAFKNQELSSGSQTFGINSHPIPEVRFEIPEYVSITGKSNWAGIKGHFGYGIKTDGKWAKDFTDGEKYWRRTLYHTKAGYLRVGNSKKFPLTFEGGLEMATFFGGTTYADGVRIKHAQGPKDFLNIIWGGGSDVDETVYKNANGNIVGSWLFSLCYAGKNWGAKVYYDHFFEDHSMMFFQYGWQDGLIGAEIKLPQNPLIGTLVYEFMNTTYQAGPVYHDHTPEIPDQVSGIDNYYNHSYFSGWHNWGQAIGNPLYTSPVYDRNGNLTFTSNRFKAHHFGVSGTPAPWLHYRLLYSYMAHLGTYAEPYLNTKYDNSFLVEVVLKSPWTKYSSLKNWQATLTLGFDRGSQLGDNTGFQLSLQKTF